MSLSKVSPPELDLDGHSTQPPSQHRRESSEFGWFDIEALLSSRAGPVEPRLWGEENSIQESSGHHEDSTLPPALERVFNWLEEVEGHHHGASNDETIIDAATLSALEVSINSSPSRQESDEVVSSKSVTKADFRLASRDRPSLAVGIYAHRLVRRWRWLIWPQSYAEFLVVIGTETELLRAWRSYSDFACLAKTAQELGAHEATSYWNGLERSVRGRRRTDPANLQIDARCLGHFLSVLLEELEQSNLGMLGDFLRKPTTYVVVGIEHLDRTSDDTSEPSDECGNDVVAKAQPLSEAGLRGSDSRSPGEGALGPAGRHHHTEWRISGHPLTPEPRVWDGL